MSLTLTLLVLTQALGLCALLINLLRAPDGYEDEAGFHLGAKPLATGTYYDAFSGCQPRRSPVCVKRARQVAA